jgi:SAM-dependent methyltransferase
MNQSAALTSALGVAIGVARPEPRTGAERAAAWIAGDILSSVLHISDAPMAYVMAAQGHDVVVADPDIRVVRDPDIFYVRTEGDRPPFAAASFDVVVVPHVQESAVALSEFARVLRTNGLLSTMTRTYDDSIPWMRKLRATIGHRPTPAMSTDALNASGLFAEPEVEEFGTWEELDLNGALRFAAQVKDPSVGDEILPAVRDLFTEYASQSGTLRLRHQTHCLRARVIREAFVDEIPPPETTLMDLR